MNLSQLRLGEAFKLTMKTMPILTVRLGVALAFWLVAAIYLGLAGGIAWLLAQVWEPLGFIFFLIALGVTVPLYNLAYRYFFFMIKAAHIAVIAELLEHGQLPSGKSQLEWGKEQVESRFGEANAMFILDEIVEGIVRAFTRTVYNLTSWIPSDSLRQISRMLQRVIRNATTYIDEAIMARSFWTRDKSVWTTAHDGVILYGMVWKPLLTNAVALMFLSYIPFIVAFVIFVGPLAGILALLGFETIAGYSIIVTLVLAFLIKVALGDAFAMTAMIASYQRETKDLVPDPAMSAQLESVSEQFVDLKNRAMEEVNRRMPSQFTEKQPTPDMMPEEIDSPPALDAS